MGNYSSNKGKRFEYFVAKKMGRKRNPLSGANNTGDDGLDRTGDIIHPTIEVECKHYKKFSVFRLWEKLKEDQKKSGKKDRVLIIREDGAKGKPIEALAIIDLDEYIRMKRLLNEL